VSLQHYVESVAWAIREAKRCPAYGAAKEPCEGLEFCEECLERAAKAALKVIEEQL
jgi:hypothetical protein